MKKLQSTNGNATIIVSKCEYNDKMKAILNDKAYKKMTQKLTTTKNCLTKHNSKSLKEQLAPRNNSLRTPHFYSLFTKLAKYIVANGFQLLTEKITYNVKNSF